MSDQTERPRYEYDAEEGFFVDNGDLDEDGLGAELVTEEVVALLNAGEAVKAREEALRAALLAMLDQHQFLPVERLGMLRSMLAASEPPGEEGT